MTERIIAQRLGIGLPQVQGTVRLLREGATIPFISRYRKEATGSLDELQVGAIKEQLDRLTELEARRQTVLTTIEGQGKLTGELRKRIEECWNAVELEDGVVPDGFYAVPVETGVSNSQYVRILSGVEEGVEVFTRYQQAAPSGGDTTSQGEEPSDFPGGGEMPDFSGGEMPDFGGGMPGGMGGGMPGGGPMG